jgi:Glycoside-hydrolase family GH114
MSALWLAAVAVLAACAPPQAQAADFPDNPAFDYQLGGAYEPPAGVTLVVRDSTAAPAPDVYNVCYVNGFQTQPADRDFWLTEHPDLILRDANGDPVVDENWPDEMLLDTRKHARLADVLAPTLLGCAEDGFDAVELDNLDSYLRSHDALTIDDNLALAKDLAAVAHDAGLTVGQKNTAELGARGRDEAGFDFAIAEECVRWRECDSYQDVYGGRVIDVEYTDDWPDPAEACADAPPSTIVRDRDLVPPGPGHFYLRC